MSNPDDNDTREEVGLFDTVLQEEPARRPTVTVEFAGASHIGKVRRKNEDHYLVTRISRRLDVLSTNVPEGELPQVLEDSAYAMVVADGMGGMGAGDCASKLAIRTGIELVLESPRWSLRVDDHEAEQLISRMKDYFRRVDATVVGQTRANPSLSGMGTTLTVAYSAGTSAFIVHAGDSRAYLFRAGVLRQLTHDHTYAQALFAAGRIAPDEVDTHASRHVLTNFVGGPSLGIVPEVVPLELADGDWLMLCSDGLTGMVRDTEITEVLQQQSSPAGAAQALIDRALDRGGKDNVTVVLGRYAIKPA